MSLALRSVLRGCPILPSSRKQAKLPRTCIMRSAPGPQNDEGRVDNKAEPSTSYTSDAGSKWRGDLTPAEVVDKYVRPYYLPGSFIFGSVFFGLRVASENFQLGEDPFGFLACTAVSGLLVMALAWVLFDLFDDSPKRNSNLPPL